MGFALINVWDRVYLENMTAMRQRRLFPIMPTSYRIFLETIREGVKAGQIPFSRSSYPAIARTMWAWLYGLIVADLTNITPRIASADPVGEGIYFFKILLRQGESAMEQPNRAKALTS